MNDNKSNRVEEFLRKTREAAAMMEKQPTPEELNRKIMNTVNKWRENETPAYDRLRDKPRTDIECFAYYHARAGVPRSVGWEYTRKKLAHFYDLEEDMKEEYDAEYNRTGFSQAFRDKIINFK